MAWLTRVSWLLGGKNVEATIVVVGLPNSGKSTLMHQLKPREVQMLRLKPTIPLDADAEKFVAKSLTFVAFDPGEASGFGNPWEDFYRHCHGLVFVVDSSDRMNMPAVQQQLDKLLHNPLIVDRTQLPLLVLANKMDNPSAVAGMQLAQILDLRALAGDRPWHVCSSDTLTGDGLNEALDWLAPQLKKICKR